MWEITKKDRIPFLLHQKEELGFFQIMQCIQAHKKGNLQNRKFPLFCLFERDQIVVPCVLFTEDLSQVTDLPTVGFCFGCPFFGTGESEGFFRQLAVNRAQFIPFGVAIPASDLFSTAEDGESTDVSAVSSGAFFHIHQLLSGDAGEGTAKSSRSCKGKFRRVSSAPPILFLRCMLQSEREDDYPAKRGV